MDTPAEDDLVVADARPRTPSRAASPQYRRAQSAHAPARFLRSM